MRKNIPPNESPIDIGKVLELANMVCNGPEHPQKMRSYAENISIGQ
jgi:hypothetical protein